MLKDLSDRRLLTDGVANDLVLLSPQELHDTGLGIFMNKAKAFADESGKFSAEIAIWTALKWAYRYASLEPGVDQGMRRNSIFLDQQEAHGLN
jgi:hypothetical protein